MSTTVYKYILDFKAQTDKFTKDVGGMKGMLKGAAIAAGALFAADKVMDAARAVGEYAKEISKVRTEIGTLTGVQGAALDALTGNVQALSDSYEQDVNATIKASNVLMREFGATSQKAFDIMNAGFASSANANDDFLQQLSEYAPHFSEAGASAEQMLAVIAEGNKMGIFSDKAADSIKEGGIRLREMTKSTQDALNMIGLSSTQIQADISSGNKSMFEVMQLVSRQLQTLPQQSPAVGAALADIFGGPGEDAVNFIRQLGEMDLSMQAVVDNATRAQMEWTNELAEFHTVGAQVFGGTNQMILGAKAVMLGWVNDSIKGIANLINYFIDLYNESTIFRGAIEYLKLTFKTTFDFVGTLFDNFWEQLKGIGKLLKAVFTGDFKAIPGIIKEAFDNTVDNFKEYGEDAALNFTEAVENTLNPRAKLKLIDLSTEAETAGIDAGRKFAAGLGTGMAGGKVQAFDMLGTVGDVKLAKSPAEILEMMGMGKKGVLRDGKLEFKPQLNLEEMQKNMPLFQENLASMGEYMDSLAEKQALVTEAMQYGFQAIGQSVVDSLGLAKTGFEGFLGQLLSTATQVIAAMLAQSIATSVFNSSQSAAATGPAAVFTQPAFMATLIGGVLAAFAAIPKFEMGGVVPGTSFTGDRMMVRVNSGEEILRSDDPRHRNNYGQRAAGRDRVIIPTARIRKGDIYISYKEAEREFLNRT